MTLHLKSEEIQSMETQHYDFEAIAREFGVVFEPTKKVSQFGGLEPFLALLRKGRIRERLAAEFGEEKARTLTQFLVGLVSGARSFKDLGNVAQDGLVGRFLKNPVGKVQLIRDFKSFTREDLERFHEFVTSLAILELLGDVPQTETLVFDVDATAVEKYGSQEGVEHGYVDRGKVETCYQYLFFRLHNLNTFLYGTIRGGSAHSQNDFCGYLSRFLPMFKARWKTAWRADSGYFNEDAFDLFSSNDATFFIKAPMSESRMALAMGSSELVWRPDPQQKGVELASRSTRTKQGTIWREIFRRTAKPNNQLTLLESFSYRYDCLATNDLVMDESAAFNFYNGRANIENNIRELKDDYRLGAIVTESFNANDAITQATLLTYLLIGHFKRKLLPPNMARSQLQTLRTYVFNIPGRMILGARRVVLKIHNTFVNGAVYARMFYKLKYLRSWVLDPPISATT